MKRNLLLCACLMTGMVFAPANAEVLPAPSSIAPNVLTFTETTEEEKSANSIVLYNVVPTTSSWSVTPKYYNITLNNTNYTFGEGINQLVKEVNAPFSPVTVTINYDEASSAINNSQIAVTNKLFINQGVYNDLNYYDEHDLNINLPEIKNNIFTSQTEDWVNVANGVYLSSVTDSVINIGDISNNVVLGQYGFDMYSSFYAYNCDNLTVNLGDISNNIFIGNENPSIYVSLDTDSNLGSINVTNNVFIGNSSSSSLTSLDNRSGNIEFSNNVYIGNNRTISDDAFNIGGTVLRNDYDSNAYTIIKDSIFSDNTLSFESNCDGANGGGVIANYGTLDSISGSNFINNSVTYGEDTYSMIYTNGGGAILNASALGSDSAEIKEIINSNFIGNNTNRSGGAIFISY